MASQNLVSKWLGVLSLVVSLSASAAWSCGEDEGQDHAKVMKSKGHSLILTAHADEGIKGVPGTKTAVFHVKGMSCGSCQKHIQGALEGLDGVKGVEFKKAGKTNVMNVAYLPEKLTTDQIVKAVPSDYTVTIAK